MQHPSERDAWDARGRPTAAALGLGGFLANFDVTSVVVVMPAIGADLGIRVDGLAWIIDAYSVAFTAALLVAGALADRFGRRRTLAIGNAWFLAASLACGLAWDGPLFLAARAAQGCGAAFLVTGTFASVATAFPAPGTRARAFGVVGVVAAVLDSRTLRSTPESGGRAGWDGHKRKKGSKVHLAVDTLGHLLALPVTPANADDRAEAGRLAEAVQDATGQSVDLAYVDQGYGGGRPAEAAAAHGIRLEVVKLPEAKRGFAVQPGRWVVV